MVCSAPALACPCPACPGGAHRRPAGHFSNWLGPWPLTVLVFQATLVPAVASGYNFSFQRAVVMVLFYVGFNFPEQRSTLQYVELALRSYLAFMHLLRITGGASVSAFGLPFCCFLFEG